MASQTDSVVASRDIDEVVVRGSSPHSPMLSTVPMYTVASSDFSRLNVSDVTSMLRRVPGVTLRDYGGVGGMKTISVRGMGTHHTGISLDGLLLSDIQSGQVDLQQFQMSEMSSLSLSIGSNGDIFQPARNFSKSSVLAVNTSNAAASSVSLTAGSWGFVSPSVRFVRSIGAVSASVSGGYTYADNNYPFTIHNGIATHDERRRNSRVSQGYVNSHAVWHVNDRNEVRGYVRLNDNDRRLPGIVRLYSNDNDERLRDRGVLSQLQLVSSVSRRVSMKSSLRFNFTEQDYHVGVPSGGIRSERYLQREYYLTTSLLYEPADALQLSYAFDYWHNSLSTTLSANPNPRQHSFLQSISGKWQRGRATLIAQMLRSDIDDEHRLSPAVSASYAVDRNRSLRIRLSAKQMFRMPTVMEKYYFHLGSPDLQPETTRQLNVGLVYSTPREKASRWTVNASCDLYINKVDDKIVAIPYNTFVWRYLNLSESHGRGADVAADISMAVAARHSLQFACNYSLQSIVRSSSLAEYDGLQIAYVPLHSGSGTLAWTNPWVNISATVTAASPTWTTNEHHPDTRIDGYSELALSLYRCFTIGSRRLAASFTMQNVLDSDYCIIAHYPMPGRNWKINVTYKL